MKLIQEVEIKVGGVPEHFNYPWKIAIERGLFKKHGVSVSFVEQLCGTGAMISELKEDNLDLIVALTEGLVTDIVRGSDLRLVGTYVESPLCWAISTGQDSDIKSLADLKSKTFGVSRFKSGSHLMAMVLADREGWDPQQDVSFRVEGNFTKLRNSVNSGATEAFMWETWTTKPFHDSKEIRRVGDIHTPWPSFMMCGRKDVLQLKKDAIQGVLAGIREAVMIFRAEVDMVRQISTKYELQLEDAAQWYAAVNITAKSQISAHALNKTVGVLKKTGILPKEKKVDIQDLLSPLASLVLTPR